MGMGYQGFARFYYDNTPENPGDAYPQVSNSDLLLCTGAGVNIVLEPIYSAAVFGQGWYNAAETSHYADAAIRYEGNIDYELQGSTTIWNFVRDWGIEQRAWPRSIDISPDGQNVFSYFVGNYAVLNDPTSAFTVTPYGPGVGAAFNNSGAWVSSMSFNTSQGSFLTSTLGMVSIFRRVNVASDAANAAVYINQRPGYIAQNAAAITGLYPLNPSQANVNPIPFWKTNANVYNVTATGSIPAQTYSTNWTQGTWAGGAPTQWQSGSNAVEWSLDIANNHVVLYTCSGTRYPTAVLMGAIGGTGSVTFYNDNGVWDPVFPPAGQTARTGENTAFRVTITTAGNPLYIDMPASYIEGDDYSIKGQSDPTTRTYTLKGLGGRVAVPPGAGTSIVYPPIVMSLAS